MTSFDIIIVGTGAGGGTLAWALRDSAARILVLDRGGFLPQEPQNWKAGEVFGQQRYKPNETWESASGESFKPGVHYCVGGNTKVYGAALPRFRREDFDALEHEGGTSPAWPITYEDLAPYYTQAEQLYQVRGNRGEDPTEPQPAPPYPHPAVPHEPQLKRMSEAFRSQGLKPFHLPMGIDLGGKCIRCHTCDGFPCFVHAKSDAEVCCVRPASRHPNVTLWTNTLAVRLVARDNRVAALEVNREGTTQLINADTYVVACGAVNSAALLLQSDNLANSSDQVGRNYMVHNNSALMTIRPWERNSTTFQKTLSINDWYLEGPDWPWPLGNLQLIGKVQASMLRAARPRVPHPLLSWLARHSMDWWVMSEDLPIANNRVTITSSGRIRIHWTPTNTRSHRHLLKCTRRIMRRAGYPVTFVETMGIATNSHQCGTLRMGADPTTSVVDPWCRTHDIANLYVVDASFFPSSAAMNPALTIAAQALRVGDHLKSTM
ncbi:MAG: GMC family oxidoreductase [Bacteroidota bacterium]|nr:GMC family oxidoreductase [Bacteroidota bacterium]